MGLFVKAAFIVVYFQSVFPLRASTASAVWAATMVKQKEVEDTVVIRSRFSWVRISSEAQTVQELDSCHCTGTSRQDGCGNEWPMLA